jgi:aminoglycoside phosphotransferase
LWLEGEAVALKLSFEQLASLEQRATRKAAIDGMGRALRDLWKDEPTAPIPERLLHLLAQLEQKPRRHLARSRNRN